MILATDRVVQYNTIPSLFSVSIVQVVNPCYNIFTLSSPVFFYILHLIWQKKVCIYLTQGIRVFMDFRVNGIISLTLQRSHHLPRNDKWTRSVQCCGYLLIMWMCLEIFSWYWHRFVGIEMYLTSRYKSLSLYRYFNDYKTTNFAKFFS